MSTKITKIKPSKKLLKIIHDGASGLKKFKTCVLEALKQGRKEGLTDLEIGDLFRTEIKQQRIEVTDRQLRNILPDSAKHSEKIRVIPKTEEIISAKQPEPEIKPEVETIPAVQQPAAYMQPAVSKVSEASKPIVLANSSEGVDSNKWNNAAARTQKKIQAVAAAAAANKEEEEDKALISIK